MPELTITYSKEDDSIMIDEFFWGAGTEISLTSKTLKDVLAEMKSLGLTKKDANLERKMTELWNSIKST